MLPMAWTHDVVGFLFLGMVGPLWLFSALCLVLALRPPEGLFGPRSRRAYTKGNVARASGGK